MMHTRPTLLLPTLLALWACANQPARAAEVMFAVSDGDWLEDSKPGRYSALNLLDGDKSTVWCSAGTGQDAVIDLQLDESTTIDRLEITMGNQSSPTAFGEYNRIKSVQITGGEMIHPLELDDKPGTQTLRFDPVIESDRVVIRLTAGYRGSKHRHTCVSDAILYAGRSALSGAKLKKAIRKVRGQREFIGGWVSGPELTRTHLLTFGLNNKVRLQFVPLDPTERAIYKKGSFRVKAKRPEVKVDRDWVQLQVKRDDAARLLKLKITGLGGLDGVYSRRALKSNP
jgi:hypothetical protein